MMPTRKSNQATLISSTRIKHHLIAGYDLWLIGVSLFVICLGLVLVASASIFIAAKEFSEPLHYFWRQGMAVLVGLSLGFVILKLPMRCWEVMSVPMLIAALLVLALVLVPGIGREVNGSMRWIQFGSFSLQASEPVKLCVIAYLAGYIVRHKQTVQTDFAGFIRPIVVLTLISGLLLLEPDFGASIVLFATALGMLFMGGVPLGRFFAWVSVAVTALTTLAIMSPYRMQRLVSFIDPWKDPYDSGFQLTQALIAFGRGEWFGVGLGSSIQKMFYLPEAHTDFVFAILAEETGLSGSVLIIFLFSFLIWRAFVIGYTAEMAGKYFAAYFAYGIGFIIGIQAYINIGVNMGVLPTKGLTLPLLSYGGNSVIVYCMLLSILLRIEYENRTYTCNTVPRTMKTYA